jgi:hypothetical protein
LVGLCFFCSVAAVFGEVSDDIEFNFHLNWKSFAFDLFTGKDQLAWIGSFVCFSWCLQFGART